MRCAGDDLPGRAATARSSRSNERRLASPVSASVNASCHCAPQLPAHLDKLCRAPAQLRLEPAHTGRELAVLVDAGAEQLQRLGSSGYDEARLVRRDLGGARKRLPVAANECFPDPSDQPAKPVAERRIGVWLRQVPGHSEALLRETVDPGGSDDGARPQLLIGDA
jgi:hypothetical protein